MTDRMGFFALCCLLTAGRVAQRVDQGSCGGVGDLGWR